ncbi:MAG: cytochrome c oxidase subunit II [Deltaproteobacteria bacterium RIFCSPLOWO2_12_FULL_40_28]|nr:MAG: cytochrome c oxidase subunit II [Deltaproteobacteria bacterium RIFCSPHIGHO2_02_FULL_40_28]OGQ20038.1 MAG: cytochrome c oxidase subunit II [Deltaproteobacteria bacterium RIFCSPHIGHO2_12_FULL_40_32]OGQ40605.1 MAG: cytochrome c oxidase subunit II [Deltaproteobacteria bacterium RIFCSPLOWO2_02_FULL_40_36]OGQ54274.1 MAG: cytochrome c oxidase subunit II [Deltaproteobacteria bacterium RIFCSPLOWO2_12_FULL_40_28]
MFTFFELPKASTIAASIDHLYDFVYWVSFVSFVGIVVACLYFIFRYHRSRSDPNKTPYIEGHHLSEIIISIILFIVVMIIFAWGWIDYKKIITTPLKPLEINITGKQWLWETEYQNGRRLTNELVVPLGQPVKLVMTSSDVLHSFFIPNFRLKQDVIPNQYTFLSFTAIKRGDHPVFCAEYCGTAHSKMLATVKVMEPVDYQKWQQEWEFKQRGGTPLEEVGASLFASKGCIACHTATDQKLVGPGMQGIYDHDVELVDGSKIKVDENYLRESLMEPQAKIVKGFAPVMPTFKGTLTDQEVGDLISYIKSLEK